MGISLTQSVSLFRAARRMAHGVASIAKTEALRVGRLPDAEYEARLEICRHCPGGHATFKADGGLHACGALLEGIKGQGQRPCGCILRNKARDANELCPFSYWPTVEGRSLSTGGGSGGGGGLLRTRRGFLAGSAALLGTLLIEPAKLLATSTTKYYIQVTRICTAENAKRWLLCSSGCGKLVDTQIKADDGYCYQLSGTVRPRPDETFTPQTCDIVTAVSWTAKCSDCQETPCDQGWPKINVTLTWDKNNPPPSVIGAGTCGGYVNWLGHHFRNGETYRVCPVWYGCQPMQSQFTMPPYSRHAWQTWEFAYDASAYRSFPRSLYLKDQKVSLWNTLNGTWQNQVRSAEILVTAGWQLMVRTKTYTHTNTIKTAIHSDGLPTHSAINVDGKIDDSLFSHLTTSDGLTVKWERGSGSWTC